MHENYDDLAHRRRFSLDDPPAPETLRPDGTAISRDRAHDIAIKFFEVYGHAALLSSVPKGYVAVPLEFIEGILIGGDNLEPEGEGR